MPAFLEGTSDSRMMSVPASRMENAIATEKKLNSSDGKNIIPSDNLDRYLFFV